MFFFVVNQIEKYQYNIYLTEMSLVTLIAVSACVTVCVLVLIEIF